MRLADLQLTWKDLVQLALGEAGVYPRVCVRQQNLINNSVGDEVEASSVTFRTSVNNYTPYVTVSTRTKADKLKIIYNLSFIPRFLLAF